jgi:hypothetical protein
MHGQTHIKQLKEFALSPHTATQEHVHSDTLLATIRTAYPLRKTYCVKVHIRTGHEGPEGE